MNIREPALHDDVGRNPVTGTVRPTYQLRVSLYDRVASLLIALLLLVGVTVLGLLIIFFTSRIFARNRAVPVTLAAVASRPPGAALGANRDFEPPGLEELPDLAQPQLRKALNSLASTVSTHPAVRDDSVLGTALLAGQGRGQGDRRQPGTGSEGIVERVPRGQRWEVHFQADSLDSYARQLDYFGIELAAIGGDNMLHYAFHLSKPKPDQRVGPPTAEKRLYMTWQNGSLIEADRELLAKAGIANRGRILVQFYPARTESMLAAEELRYATGHNVNDIRKTTFAVKRKGNGFVFYVVGQEYF